VVPHQLPEVDVVTLVDWREGRSDDDPDSRPALALSGSLTTRSGTLAMPGHYDLEPPVQQGVRLEHTPAFVNQAGVGILGYDCRFVVEADPSRSHDIGVDVVKQIIDPEIFHMQIETFVELLANQPEILGEEQDPLARGQGNLCRGPLI
jgi:hypothetical protein